MSARSIYRSAATGLLAAGLWLTGCFQVNTLDRTQPNKVEKSLFADGSEWFFRQTVIDVPATSGLSFIGEQGTTERVRWDIQEDYLFAYRAYPWQEGGDGHVRPGSGPYTDSPVAAFKIASHFDVQRQYNPATGEQTNVLEENSSDRPWYDRQYMRVDWSANLIADFQFSAAAVKQQPVTFYNGEDPTHVTNDAAVVSGDYIDIVHTVTAEPEVNEAYTSYFGFPILECWLYSNVHQDCLGAQLKIRSSFRKAPAQSDYMPLEFDDIRFAKFGYFRAERYGYNPEYGVVEPAATRLANRFNIWEDAQSCFDPEAEKPYASCDPEQLKTIVYYLNSDFPAEHKAWAVDNGDEWNRVFREAVLAATGWNEDRLGNNRMFTVCANNPVQADDPPECGPVGRSPQIGDLRYNMYYYVPDAQESSPLGYGPSAQDPLTGETIQGNAFYYGAPGKWIAARTRDIIKLELGILAPEDVSGGIPVQDAVARMRARESSRFRNFVEGFDKDRIVALTEQLDIKEKALRLNHQIETGEAMMDLRPGRIERLAFTSLDEQLMTPELQDLIRGLGVEQDDSSGPAVFHGIDDMERLLTTDMFALARYRESRLLSPKAGGCILTGEEFFDSGLTGLLSVVKSKFYDMTQNPPVLKDGHTEEELYEFLVGRTMADTQLHEIGHTVGLRHNFAGSTDALNFGAKYWQLRGPGYTMGASDKRPRAMWQLNSNAFITGYEAALSEGIVDTQDSSVMDYASTYGTNTTLGLYDAAAIKYAYGDVVEIFNTPDVTKDRAALLRPGELHYTYYPEAVSNATTYEERVAAMYDRRAVNWRFTEPESDLFDDSLVEVPYVFCSDEYRDASAICATWDSGLDNYERTLKKTQDYKSYHLYDAFKRERVGFGVDVFSYLQRVYNRSFMFILNQYKNWVNDELIIRRDRPCVWYEDGQRQEEGDRFVADACGLAGFLGAAEGLNLFGEIIQTPDVGCYARLAPGCYYVNPINEDGIDGTPVELVSDDPAACDSLAPIPESDDVEPQVPLKVTGSAPFHHVPDSTSCEGFEPITDATSGDVISETQVDIPYGVGRAANTLYDRQKYGYYFYWKPVVMGSWWDKWLAVKAIGDPWTDFIGVDASSDTRSFMISFNTLFAEEINNLLGGVVSDNPAVYGAVLSSGSERDVEFVELLSMTGSFDRDANTRPYLDPDQQYTFRLLAMFNAAYQSQVTDDLEFSESIQVGRSYANTPADIPDSIKSDPLRYAEFRDPETGYLYYGIRQDRAMNNGKPIYSTGWKFVREVKDRYFVGGADGPGIETLEGYYGWQLQSDIRILEIMRQTRETFGKPDVWSGDF